MPVCELTLLGRETMISVRFESVDVVVIWNDGGWPACERACPHEQADLGVDALRRGGCSVSPRGIIRFARRSDLALLAKSGVVLYPFGSRERVRIVGTAIRSL
jgi:hypothetical protein